MFPLKYFVYLYLLLLLASCGTPTAVRSTAGSSHSLPGTIERSNAARIDFEKFPDYGRDISYTMGEAGLAGHWLKWFMHYMFLHKAKGYPFWYLLPE